MEVYESAKLTLFGGTATPIARITVLILRVVVTPEPPVRFPSEKVKVNETPLSHDNVPLTLTPTFLPGPRLSVTVGAGLIVVATGLSLIEPSAFATSRRVDGNAIRVI
jgi:hypothetical protein